MMANAYTMRLGPVNGGVNLRVNGFVNGGGLPRRIVPDKVNAERRPTGLAFLARRFYEVPRPLKPAA